MSNSSWMPYAESIRSGLLALKTNPRQTATLTTLMRAAQHIATTSGTLQQTAAEQLALALVECFSAAEKQLIRLKPEAIELLSHSLGTLTTLPSVETATAPDPNLLNLLDRLMTLATTPDFDFDEDSTAADGTPSAANPDSANQELWMIFYQDFTDHIRAMTENLLALEEDPQQTKPLTELMRSAHTIKGACRAISAVGLLDLNPVASLAHKLEDALVAIQNHRLQLGKPLLDTLLSAVDCLSFSVEQKQPQTAEIEQIMHRIGTFLSQPTTPLPPPPPATEQPTPDKTQPANPTTADSQDNADRSIRVNAETLDRLMGLAGQSFVESRWLQPFIGSLIHLKRQQTTLIAELDALREQLGLNETQKQQFDRIQQKTIAHKQTLSERLSDLEMYNRRNHNLAHRLYQETISSRMRPFGDGIQGLQRMVRDIAHSLHKQAKLKFSGLHTPVDRDILHKMQAPLNHMLRNALDHGIETPEERQQKGKPQEGQIHLQAIHKAGSLIVRISDDGRGVDLAALRLRVIEKGFASEEMAAHFTDNELLDFLFLPRFTTKTEVSELSGRGVGLDVVHDFIREVRGRVYATTVFNKGMQIELQLPLTLSVMRTLLVEIAGEAYAFPLSRSERVLKLAPDQLEMLEGRPYFTWQQHPIGLISARQVLELEPETNPPDYWSVLIMGDRTHYYGLVVDRFLGEKDVVVQPLDSRLGKIRDIQAAALLEDGSPILIIDVDDLLNSIAQLSSQPNGHLPTLAPPAPVAAKRILVVDDSITVREVQRKLLETQGYQVDVAVDGLDGLEHLQEQDYDLLITDIDMPRMDGIELIQTIKQRPHFKTLPIMIVSYKDNPKDRELGLHAGADYYLTKYSFQDNSLLEAVLDLIGNSKN